VSRSFTSIEGWEDLGLGDFELRACARRRRWQATNVSARAPGSAHPDQSRRNHFGSLQEGLPAAVPVELVEAAPEGLLPQHVEPETAGDGGRPLEDQTPIPVVVPVQVRVAPGATARQVVVFPPGGVR